MTTGRVEWTGGSASVGDYFELLKPRVMSLVIFTALTGMVLAPGGVHPLIGFVGLLAIAVGAGASGALNMWYDADIDRVMSRTARRPVPDGRISASAALQFGVVLSVLSVMVLGVAVNWVAGSLLAFTIFFYVVVYTMGLKRRTPQNIVIGGAAGAFPPMIGWAAVTGAVSVESIVLFLIIFMWTPPHFWALALVKSDDYARAGVPMMPVVAGPGSTRRQIVLYSVLLAPIGVLPTLLGFAGLAYGAVAAVLGVVFLALAVQVARITEGPAARTAAMRLFFFSILYLFALFAVLLVEHLAVLHLAGA
nr:heme o synthase [Chthonobacter rhizosphaerae]